MRGCDPVVAINKHNHIISVHMSSILRRLYVTYGVIRDKKINWIEDGEPLEYDTGKYPAVTLNNGGQLSGCEKRMAALVFTMRLANSLSKNAFESFGTCTVINLSLLIT